MRGAARVRCRAELPDIFLEDREVTLLDVDRPQPAGFGWFSAGESKNRGHVYHINMTCS